MTTERNQAVVGVLNEIAELLEAQGANPFRVNAYRRAAETVASLTRDVADLVAAAGAQGLAQLPAIGSGISRTLVEYVETGRSSIQDRLRGQLDPEHLFCTLPGIGPRLAQRIHDELHVDTLEALELTAYDGRLSHMSGFGTKRLAALRDSLNARLSSRRFTARKAPGQEVPPIALLISVDEEYQRLAADGALPLVAPRRFNADGKRRLPILHADRNGWHFTALYSNTARAHQLRRTRDWVVIHYYDHDHEEGQCTVVTEWQGRLSCYRVVRGRESECDDFYRQRRNAVTR